jgi:hypothetical protein
VQAYDPAMDSLAEAQKVFGDLVAAGFPGFLSTEVSSRGRGAPGFYVQVSLEGADPGDLRRLADIVERYDVSFKLDADGRARLS